MSYTHTRTAYQTLPCRLTSTPYTNGRQDVFRLPLPKIEGNTRRTRYNSASDSPITNSCQDVFRLPPPKIEGTTRQTRYNSTPDSSIITTTTTTTTITTVEIDEVEVTCKETINQKPLRVKARSLETLHRPSRTKATVGPRLSPSRTITRLRKPAPVFTRLLKEADYLAHRVLRYMSGKDLLRVSHVNRQLRELILQDKVLDGRRMNYVNAKRTDRDRVGKVRNVLGVTGVLFINIDWNDK